MENIVPITDIGQSVADTLLKISEGVEKARAAGLQAELPKEVQFTMLAVVDFQKHAIDRAENGEQTETQGGGSKEITISKGTDLQITDRSDQQSETRSSTETSSSTESGTRTDSGKSESRNVHDQDSTTTYIYASV